MADNTTSGPSPNDPPRAYQALLEWMAQQDGHLHESVQLARDDARGVHLQVRKDWKDARVAKETRVIKTPLSSTMSYFNVVDHRLAAGSVAAEDTFSAHGLHLPKAFVDAVGAEEASVFFLMGQYLKGAESFWAPYIQTLPQPGELTTPLYYDGEDLEWLSGTSLVAAREQKNKLFREKYEFDVEELRKTGFDTGAYTWDLYLWASTIFVSRAFSAKVLSGAIADEDLPEDSVSVLLPFVDILNHRPLAKVEWRAAEKDVLFLTLEEVAAGQEVSNNYGPRNNEQLMMNYGFCLPDNSCDYRIVGLRAQPGSPLDQAKAAQRQMFPEVAAQSDDSPYYVFNIFYPLLAPGTSMEHSIFSPALFNAVSILAANDRELEALEITELGIRIPNDQYGTSRTILAALSQIIIELITHVVKLRSSGADLQQQQPKNIKQTHAQVYRDSQIRLSETALVIAAWTLSRSQQHNYTGTWEEIKTLLGSHMARVPANKFPDEVLSRIRVRILERPSILTNNGELFTLDDLYPILPESMQQPCKTCLQSILTTTERAIPMFQGNAESSPFVFPLFVCFVAAAYRTNAASLSPRLSRWAQMLLDKYPAPPDDVAWMLEDEDDEQLVTVFDDEVLETMRTRNSAVFSGLTAYTGDWQADHWWLSPNWIRWAWMLVEQESVQVPDDPLSTLSATGQVMLSTVSTLYIPQ